MQPSVHFKYLSDPAAKLIYIVLNKPAIPQPEFNVGADDDTTQANDKYLFVGFQPKIIDQINKKKKHYMVKSVMS